VKRMKPWHWAAVAVVALVIAVVAWRILGNTAEPEDASPPAALVTLAPVRAASVEETVSAYGVIGGSPRRAAPWRRRAR